MISSPVLVSHGELREIQHINENPNIQKDLSRYSGVNVISVVEAKNWIDHKG